MGSPDRVLREGFEYQFSAVDPVAGAHIDPVGTAVYETLVAKGVDGETQPSLAESWTVSPDGLEYRFRLREGLRFHSGAPCDARAVAAALERCRWGDVRTRQIQYWDPVAAVSAEDERTVLVRTHYPTTRVMPLLWGTHTTIFNPAMRERLGAAYGCEAADGTGPYRLVEWSVDRVAAERAETYAGTPARFVRNRTRPAPIRRIEWITALDPDERMRLLLEGEVDCLHAPPAERLGELDSQRFEVLSAPQYCNVYFALNWGRRDLGFFERSVREAISLAIDRPALVRMLLDGHGDVTYGPVPPGSEFYDPASDRAGRHDVGQAERQLDAAGFVRGADGIRARNGVVLQFECVVQDDSVLLGAARLVQAQLARVGIALVLEPVVPFAPFYKRLSEGPASFLSKWLWQDPIDALIGFTSSACQPRPNWERASVPELDYAFDRFRQATTREGVQAAASTAQALIARDLPIVPLFTPADIFVRSRAVAGWDPISNNLYPFYQDVHFRP
ncbi:MAG TPA: ABC transporter substrate-binding protein [Devosia sp.]|nr:ABC transporter substrate-binding protein [Devosia sp.]